MKTLRFFGMILMTVMMAFNMTACGDDDDDNGDYPGGADYVGIWIEEDTQQHMDVITLTANTWKSENYRLKEGQAYKESDSGSLTVNGNTISVSGDAPFTTATYSVSGNKLTITAKTEKGDETMTLTRATDDQIKKIAAWETLILISQQK